MKYPNGVSWWCLSSLFTFIAVQFICVALFHVREKKKLPTCLYQPSRHRLFRFFSYFFQEHNSHELICLKRKPILSEEKIKNAKKSQLIWLRMEKKKSKIQFTRNGLRWCVCILLVFEHHPLQNKAMSVSATLSHTMPIYM